MNAPSASSAPPHLCLSAFGGEGTATAPSPPEGVAPEVAEEICVFLEDRDPDAGAGERAARPGGGARNPRYHRREEERCHAHR
jgi:hypothetical protein